MLLWLSFGDVSRSDIFLSFSVPDGISLVELKVPKRKKAEEEERQQQQQTKHLRSSAAMSLSDKLKPSIDNTKTFLWAVLLRNYLQQAFKNVQLTEQIFLLSENDN